MMRETRSECGVAITIGSFRRSVRARRVVRSKTHDSNQPSPPHPHWCGVENTSADASVSCASHEPGTFKNPKMFGDRRPRHPKRFGQFADSRFAEGEPTENRPSGAVGKCSEGAVEASVTGNHSVTNLLRGLIGVKLDV